MTTTTTFFLLFTAGCCVGLAKADGKYWWMESGNAFNDNANNQQTSNYPQQNIDVSNNYQGSGVVLPVTQGIQSQASQGNQVVQSQAQTSCPAVSAIPPVSQCQGRVSNCWSVGQTDVDCIDNALCCFDGCANVCQGAGSRSPAPPPNPPRQNQVAANNIVPQPKPPAKKVQPKPAKKVQQKPKVQRQPAMKDPWPNQQAPRRPQQNVDPWPQQQQQQPRRPQQQQPRQPQQQQNSNVRQQSNNNAASKPFVRCPSAMKCVPKVNCNLEGVMVNEVLNYSPQVEMLRVPLIPCVNMAAGNVVDVCCRDPNYQDPWPNMNGNNGITNNQVNARTGRRTGGRG